MSKNNDKLIEQLDKKRIDDFLAHQCMVRRFQSLDGTDYQALRAVRDDLETTLSDVGLRRDPSPPILPSSTAMLRLCMEFLESGTKRELLQGGNTTEIGTALLKDFSREYDEATLSLLSKRELARLAEKMTLASQLCGCLHSKYNFFDYFSLIAMSVKVDFPDFYRLYLGAYHKKLKLWAPVESTDQREVNWLFLKEPGLPADIDLVVNTACGIPRFYSPNIDIFSDAENAVTLNGKRSKDSVYMRINLDWAPGDIDHAITYFKQTLVQLLIQKHGSRAAVYNEEFEQSGFVSNWSTQVNIVSQWNMVTNSILGLWCWDLVEANGMTAAAAARQIQLEIEEIGKTLATSTPFYPSDRIAKYHDIIARIISSGELRNTSRKSPKTLDEAITGRAGLTLGRRNVSVHTQK